MKHPESGIQKKVVEYLEFLHVLHNGSVAGIHTTELQRKIYKGLGARDGYPDLSIFEPRKGYHGLFLELKAANNTPTQSQIEWASELTKRGYRAEICPVFKTDQECYHWAIDIINEYLGVE
jgi:hypothetical protein